MTGLKLNDKNDIEISGGDILLVEDLKLEEQTMRTVLGTNKGEWPFNPDEGIDFRQLIGKGVTSDMARSQITSGIHQVNKNRNIENFTYQTVERHAVIDFTAREQGGSNIALTTEF